VIYPWRRQQGLKRVHRILRAWRGQARFDELRREYTDSSLLAKKLLRTRKPCSRPCCGNPRRWFGKRTPQELRADAMMQEQIVETLL